MRVRRAHRGVLRRGGGAHIAAMASSRKNISISIMACAARGVALAGVAWHHHHYHQQQQYRSSARLFLFATRIRRRTRGTGLYWLAARLTAYRVPMKLAPTAYNDSLPQRQYVKYPSLKHRHGISSSYISSRARTHILRCLLAASAAALQRRGIIYNMLPTYTGARRAIFGAYKTFHPRALYNINNYLLCARAATHMLARGGDCARSARRAINHHQITQWRSSAVLRRGVRFVLRGV